jgi:hypothetical protein
MKRGFFTYLQVEDRGKGHHDGNYGFIGYEIGIGLKIAASVLPGLSFPLIGVPTPEADELYLGEILMDMLGIPSSVFANTDETDMERGFHNRG